MTKRLPNFFKSKRLNDLKNEMGVTENFKLPEMILGRISLEEIKKLKSASIDITNIKDYINPIDGTFDYKGQKVLLYIKEQRYQHFDGIITYKYHLSYCDTLDWMDNNGRFARYVVTQRADGYFLIDILERYSGRFLSEDQLYNMQVCKNCLKALNKHYPKDSLFHGIRQFEISKFIQKYNTKHKKKPEFTPHTLPKNKYPENWPKLSLRIREDAGFICSKCNEDFNGKKSLLHVHHIDGFKWNSDPKNLEVLCINCHSEEPGHQKLINGFNKSFVNP